ncbi:MAG: L-dopachrome tautomerase-related protein [Rhizobiaceae bacterium]
MLKWIKRIAIVFCLLAVGLCGTLYYFFGGGEPYRDLTSEPALPPGTIEAAVVSDRPIGNATVSADGRVFYTIHPESNPVGTKLYEWVDGKPVAYPNAGDQDRFFESPLGVVVDSKNWLWVIDPGTHGLGTVAITAFDLATNELVHRKEFSSDIAPVGSFLQDMQVSTDGEWIYIADVGYWAKRPGIVVYNTRTQKSWRVLNRHESVYPQNILIRSQIRDMSYFGGLLEMKTGVDGIALSRDDQWLYFAAMNHDTLYRVPTTILQQPDIDDGSIAEQLEAVGKKPLNDGLSIDDQNNVYISDIEHQAVVRMAPNGTLTTIVKDDRIRWADGLKFGPGGWLYLADSAIPHVVLQNADYHKKHAPYYVWRFRPGTKGAAGQ